MTIIYPHWKRSGRLGKDWYKSSMHRFMDWLSTQNQNWSIHRES